MPSLFHSPSVSDHRLHKVVVSFLKFPWGIKLTRMHRVLSREVSKWKQKEGASSHQLTFSRVKASSHHTCWAAHILQLDNCRQKAQSTQRAFIKSPTFDISSLFIVKNDPSGILQANDRKNSDGKNQGRKHGAKSLHCSASNKTVMTKMKQIYLIWMVKRKIKLN